MYSRTWATLQPVLWTTPSNTSEDPS
jgi:hypothetical protein